MFVPRSARRIRLARAAFVGAAILPCAALVAWAVHRHSAAHRDAIRREWEQAVGLPITVDSVEHPLPGVVRARGWSLSAADGRAVLGGAAVVVERSPTEVRLALGSLDCDPAGVAALSGLAGEWLLRGARFRRDVVIDVADFAWRVSPADGRAERRALGPVRIECVTQDGTRAIRIVRREAEAGADEVRIVRSAGADNEGPRVDVEATCTEPLPLPMLAAVAGTGAIAAPPCSDAVTLQGRLAASWTSTRSTGNAAGRVANVDLAAWTATLPAGAAGTADIEVRGLEWRDGRIATCELACAAAAGRIDRRLLDALVATLGCRPGAALVGAEADRQPAFDALGYSARLDGRGLELRGAPRLGGALAVAGGRPLLEPPAGIVPPERLAWLLAPPGAVYVPSSGPGAWLLSLLPRAGAPVERTSQADHGAESAGF